jgi:type I restriction enzyme S subunit
VSLASYSYKERQPGEVLELKYGKSLPESQRVRGAVPVFGSNGLVGNHDASITSGETSLVGRKGSIGAVNYSSVGCWAIDTTYYIDRDSAKVKLRWLTY